MERITIRMINQRSMKLKFWTSKNEKIFNIFDKILLTSHYYSIKMTKVPFYAKHVFIFKR